VDESAAVKAEAKAVRREDGSTVVPLVTDDGTVLDIIVPAPAEWYEGAVEALTAGRISEWVKLAVEDSDSRIRWDSVRKRYRQLDAFLTAWTKATGESPGESPGSSAS
jgi:hypothetical protein